MSWSDNKEITKLRYYSLDTPFKILPPVQPLKFANGVKLTIRIFRFTLLVLPIETQLAMKETRKTSNLFPRKRKVSLKEILYG